MNKLSKKTYYIYGIGVAYAMLDQIFVQWLKYFYLPPENSGLEPLLNARYIIIAFVIMRIVDAIADPVVGYYSDKCESKLGKRSFYMILGGLPLGLATVLFFYPMGKTQEAIFAYLTFIGSMFFIAYTLVGVAYNALVADLSSNKEDRINLSTIQSIFRLTFTAIPLIFSGIIIDKFTKLTNSALLGFRYTIIIFSIVAILFIYICALFLNEKNIVEYKEKKKNASFRETIKTLKNKEVYLYFVAFFLFFSSFNIIRGSLSYYVSLILNKGPAFVTILSAFLFSTAALFFPITSKLTKKYDFRKVMIADILIIVIGTLGMILFSNSNISMIYICCAIIGAGISGSAFIFPPAMLSELSNKISAKNNVSVEGLMFGIQGFFLKLAFMVEVIISISAVLYKSVSDNQGLRRPTKEGVILSLIIAIIMLIISSIIYYLNKNDGGKNE